MMWLGLESYSEFERLRADRKTEILAGAAIFTTIAYNRLCLPAPETVEVSAKFHGGASEYVQNSGPGEFRIDAGLTSASNLHFGTI
jgi:hypothetical protein